jgi:hypothetical protein
VTRYEVAICDGCGVEEVLVVDLALCRWRRVGLADYCLDPECQAKADAHQAKLDEQRAHRPTPKVVRRQRQSVAARRAAIDAILADEP